MTGRKVEQLIIEALQTQGGFLSRPRLERLVCNEGATPGSFTKATARLVAAASIRIVPIRVHGYPDGKAFTNREVSAEEVAQAERLYADRIDARSPQLLGPIAEEYTRAVFAKGKKDAPWFTRVPRKRLGHLPLLGGAVEADIVIGLDRSIFTTKALLVEVKNASEAFATRKEIFSKLVRQALITGLQPALVTPRLSPDAELFCRQIGIATLILGKQIVPSERMRDFRRLWGSEARELFQAFNANRPFRGRYELGNAAPHVATVANFQWVHSAHKAWTRNTNLMPQILAAMETADRTILEALRIRAEYDGSKAA